MSNSRRSAGKNAHLLSQANFSGIVYLFSICSFGAYVYCLYEVASRYSHTLGYFVKSLILYLAIGIVCSFGFHLITAQTIKRHQLLMAFVYLPSIILLPLFGYHLRNEEGPFEIILFLWLLFVITGSIFGGNRILGKCREIVDGMTVNNIMSAMFGEKFTLFVRLLSILSVGGYIYGLYGVAFDWYAYTLGYFIKAFFYFMANGIVCNFGLYFITTKSAKRHRLLATFVYLPSIFISPFFCGDILGSGFFVITFFLWFLFVYYWFNPWRRG